MASCSTHCRPSSGEAQRRVAGRRVDALLPTKAAMNPSLSRGSIQARGLLLCGTGGPFCDADSAYRPIPISIQGGVATVLAAPRLPRLLDQEPDDAERCHGIDPPSADKALDREADHDHEG